MAIFGSIAATLVRLQRERAILERERVCVRAAIAEGVPPMLARLRCNRQVRAARGERR